MKKNLYISAIAAMAILSACGNSSATATDSDTAASVVADTAAPAVDTAEAEAPAADSAKEEEQALEARIREIWKRIPTVNNPGNPESVMTPEFKNMYSTAQSGAEISGDIDLMEKITWIDYQDAAPGAKIEWIKINSIDGDNATATVKYKDNNIPEPHKLKLKRIGGVWLLDDFDMMRKTCQEIIYLTTA